MNELGVKQSPENTCRFVVAAALQDRLDYDCRQCRELCYLVRTRAFTTKKQESEQIIDETRKKRGKRSVVRDRNIT